MSAFAGTGAAPNAGGSGAGAGTSGMPGFGAAGMPAAGHPAEAGAAAAAGVGGDAAMAAPVPALPPVSFNPPGGGFAAPFSLQLAPADGEAEVFYTLDGSLPTPGSTAYVSAIAIAETTLVRAIAVRNGVASAIVQHVYLQVEASAQDFASNLPVVVAHLLGGAPPSVWSREYVPALVSVFRPASGRTMLLGAAEHTSRAGIKLRGRSTRNDAKPSYTFELWGAAQEDVKLPLLELPADGDFVLYSPYVNDRSLLRNALIYALSNAIGRYAARTRFCELFVVANAAAVSEAAYAGVYVLTERLERSDDRIDIARLEPDDVSEPEVSGGYVFQKDQSDELGDSFFAAGDSFQWVEPKFDQVVPEQIAYITEYLDSIIRALDTSGGTDPLTGLHYTALIDSAAFIDHHILNVLAKNPDASAYSAYFHKDRGGKLHAGPIWDFDLSMGANDPFGNRSANPEGWGPSPGESLFERGFYAGLFRQPEFVSAYWARWQELLAGPFLAASVRARVDAFAAELGEAQERNRARWPEAAPRNASYPDEIAALQQWLEARITWISANTGTLP